MASILVVEDDAIMRDMLILLLERKDHNVYGAENGKEAEKLCKHFVFDVVITDIIMPVQEGMETIMILKHSFPKLKIIAMTGGGKTSPKIYLQVARKLGAHFALEKPFKHKDLIHAVDSSLALA
jgi:CheY-like chemotaxis protein